MTGNSTTATSISLDESGMLDDVNYVFGSHLYVRKLVINMDDVLATLKENIRYIHLYCDTLECKVIDSYSYKFYMPSNVHTLHIFARSFLPKVSEILCWSDYNAQEIAVYYDQSLSPASLLVKEEVDHDGIAINHQLINCPERKVNSDGSITEAGHTHVFDQVTNPPAFPTELENANYHNQNESAALTDAGKPISTPLMSSLGRRIILSSTDEEMKVLPLRIVPQVELEEPSLADIQAFGKDMRKTSNLFGLLYQILRSVTMTIFTGQGIDTMISKLRFIIQCTHSSPSHGRFTANAQKLLERLQCSISYPAISSSKDTRYYIPQLRLRECINVLQVGVKGAVEIQKQLDTLAKELAKEDDLHKGFSTILEQMGTNIAVFIESAKDTEKAQTAIENWETQKQAMLSANDNLKIARDTFNGGIKKYNQEKQKELKEEMLKISGELIVSVVTAIATCGAGAPLTVGNLEKAQKAIAKGVETGDKLKVLLEKICQAAANIAPKMSAASKSQQACNQIMDRINKSESGDSSSNKQGLKDAAETLTQKTLATMPDDVTARVDYIGIRADWEEFDHTVQELFAEIQRSIGNDTITGMIDYKLALQSQSTRGKAVINAMELAHEAVQLFIRHETELVARTKRSDELRAIARKMRDPMSRTKAEQALRWNLIRESIIARSSVFVYFHECFLALIYQTNNPRQVKDYFNRPESPVLIDSSAEAFDSLLRHITTKYGEYSSTYNSMGTPITIKASEYPDMFPNWQTTLKTDMKIAFNIPHNRLVHLRDWYHVRINTASAKLIGFDISGTEHAWKWSFGPQSVDVDQSGSPISYYSILRPLTQRGGVGGWQEKEAKFPHPSLFSQGEILVCPESKDWTSPPPKLDLSGVTDVILCFECDGLSK